MMGELGIACGYYVVYEQMRAAAIAKGALLSRVDFLNAKWMAQLGTDALVILAMHNQAAVVMQMAFPRAALSPSLN